MEEVCHLLAGAYLEVVSPPPAPPSVYAYWLPSGEQLSSTKVFLYCNQLTIDRIHRTVRQIEPVFFKSCVLVIVY